MIGLRAALLFGAGIMLVYGGYIVSTEVAHAGSRSVEHGIASWYGREEEGRRTASGERFNPNAYTAASRHLPLNSIVRVTNENNGRSVKVRINDRGPFVHSRVLDLSEAAADTLDMKKTGTAPVKIELLAPPSAQAASAP
jgi:rare lipoprotein A